MKGRDFQVANSTLHVLVKTIKRDGKYMTQYKTPISSGDLQKMSTSPVLSIAHSVVLEQKADEGVKA